MSRIDLDNPTPSLFQKMQISIFGQVKIGKHKQPGWSGPIEYYLFLCKKHGYVTQYAQTYSPRLPCPKCAKEDSKK